MPSPFSLSADENYTLFLWIVWIQSRDFRFYKNKHNIKIYLECCQFQFQLFEWEKMLQNVNISSEIQFLCASHFFRFVSSLFVDVHFSIYYTMRSLFHFLHHPISVWRVSQETNKRCWEAKCEMQNWIAFQSFPVRHHRSTHPNKQMFSTMLVLIVLCMKLMLPIH